MLCAIKMINISIIDNGASSSNATSINDKSFGNALIAKRLNLFHKNSKFQPILTLQFCESVFSKIDSITYTAGFNNAADAIKELVGTGTIVVTNLYGKQIKTLPLSLGINTIDIANFAKGIYFVSVITNDGKRTEKLIVE